MQPKVVKWKIWYDNREPFSSDNGTPEDAPLDGIQVIVQWWDNGTKEKLHSNDYYYWINGKQWIDGNSISLEKWIRKLIPQIKYGRFTDNESFREIKEEAFHD